MNTCDTCMWWGNEKWLHVYGGDSNRRICGHPKVQDYGNEGDDEVEIYNSIDSSIITGPKFGCIHHEPK